MFGEGVKTFECNNGLSKVNKCISQIWNILMTLRFCVLIFTLLSHHCHEVIPSMLARGVSLMATLVPLEPMSFLIMEVRKIAWALYHSFIVWRASLLFVLYAKSLSSIFWFIMFPYSNLEPPMPPWAFRENALICWLSLVLHRWCEYEHSTLFWEVAKWVVLPCQLGGPLLIRCDAILGIVPSVWHS